MKVIFVYAFMLFLAYAYSQSGEDTIELQSVEDDSDVQSGEDDDIDVQSGRPPYIRCPPRNFENATLLPNPMNCSTYFVCDHGRPIPMRCPDGLHFNPVLSVCDWSWRAGCNQIRLA